jgi:ABC-type polysaccharide/polyol phosphate export permease
VTIAGFDRRDLGMLINLFRMQLNDRFLGSALGTVWAILAPLLLMATFCFVFTFVFPSRLPGKEGALPYLVWLLSGYGPWLGMSDGISTGTGSVVGSSGIVKNIAFKSELLPIVSAMMGFVPLAVAIALIFVLQIGSGQGVSPAVIFLPLAILLQLIFVSGIGLFLGALNVFVRDTALILPNILMLLLFASPIFYPITSYPRPLQPFVSLNPFYLLAECYRAPIMNGRLPNLTELIYLIVLSAALFAGGLWWFRRLKSFFDTRL